jgi:hypothetical protein
MISAQWFGGPRDGDWIDLESARPIIVISGNQEHPERRRIVPRKLNRRWILDFYTAKVLKDGENE